MSIYSKRWECKHFTKTQPHHTHTQCKNVFVFTQGVTKVQVLDVDRNCKSNTGSIVTLVNARLSSGTDGAEYTESWGLRENLLPNATLL